MALKNDIPRYELQMESLKLGLTSLHNNRSILNHQLLNTLGMNQEDKGKQEMQIIPDATIADKAYAKDGEAYWQTASTMNSPLLEQSSNAIRIAEQKEKIAKSDLLPKVALVTGHGGCIEPEAQRRTERGRCPHQHRIRLLPHEIHSGRNLGSEERRNNVRRPKGKPIRLLFFKQ